MTRNVVVTGGSSGIGLAVAKRFAAAGDQVLITGRDLDRAEAAAGEFGARAAQCDATSPADVEALVAAIDGQVDVLVNMAGGNTDFASPDVAEPSLQDVADAWTANLAANTLSAVLTTTALLPRMGRGSTIIAVGSIGAEYAATSYGASKAAVSAWIAGLSAQVGPKGITANTISPGYIENTAFFGDNLSDERRTALIAATHDKRPGTPEDVAGLTFFLAGEDARHITGQCLHLNGGAFTTR
ncbi:SDR family NAD(P)-dependent oxidoreductase [Aeromicrobium sp. 9AM]|uniref:SDR family NAD(P)-dependent oxidoreductase n=1 Tax=Aeromicrobium sp. 9AM TaxID=2653126 RepID=UPI0012F1F4EE|nr:SDR family oxidoreductase [Aeromicrobium sp. 9AM]VXB56340.1 3-oxoacyl-ACP reductase [Aeromicrobium sp. 9AM]